MAAPEGNSNAIGNKGGGRPPEYNKKYCGVAYKLCLLGATDQDLAEAFDVSEQTINNWKRDFIEFSLALKKGKTLADANVVESLYKRANGYSHPDVDIKVIENKITITKLKKHYPPDTTAAIFWLKNRQKANWKDKQSMELTGENGGAIQIIQIPDNGRNNNSSTGGVPDPGTE